MKADTPIYFASLGAEQESRLLATTQALSKPRRRTSIPPKWPEVVGGQRTGQLVAAQKDAALMARNPISYDASVLEEWEGTVTEVSNEEFSAELRSLTHDRPREHARFSMSEVSPEDDPLIDVGAIFYWTIGSHLEHGTKKMLSALRFRRLPPWSARDLEKIKERGRRLAEVLAG